MNDIIKKINDSIEYHRNNGGTYTSIGLEFANCIILEETKDNIFLKIPKKVKLSSIAKMYDTKFDCFISRKDYTLYCLENGLNLKVDKQMKLIDFELPTYYGETQIEFKYVYGLWLANTEIEVDI